MRALIGLLASTTLSNTGNAIVAVAVPWLVLERTGSATAAGLAGAAAIVPVALSALFGGALVDRVGRRTCAVAADVLSALAVAALPSLDRLIGLGMPLLLVLVAIGAVFDGPGAAAREALRPDVARRSGTPLPKLNAWGEAAESVGNMVGAGVGGVLLVAVGGFGALWATVAIFLLSAAVTALTMPGAVSAPPVREPYLRSVVDACASSCATGACEPSRSPRRSSSRSRHRSSRSCGAPTCSRSVSRPSTGWCWPRSRWAGCSARPGTAWWRTACRKASRWWAR